MFCPFAERIMFLLRPLMKMLPFLSRSPRSPVRIQPSAVNAAFVASSFLKYPLITFIPRAWISPTLLYGSSESIRTSIVSIALPHDFEAKSHQSSYAMRGAASVMPYPTVKGSLNFLNHVSTSGFKAAPPMTISRTLPPNAFRREVRTFLKMIWLRPGMAQMTFMTGLLTIGATLLLKIFSITRGTVITRYGFTSAIAPRRRAGVGVFPR